MSQDSVIAFEIVNNLRRATRISDILQEMRAAGGVFGYDAFIITNLPSEEEISTQNCAMVPSWPEGWRKRYFERDYLRIDPVAHQVKRTTEPFLWSEAPYSADDTASARVMNEATEFSLTQGFCVPIHHMNGLGGGVSFGAKHLDLSEAAKAALHLVSMYAYQRAETLIREAGNAPARKSPKLSAREVECLKWTAAGKTSWEASEILSTSQRTIEFHLKNAARKLDAVNRVQCVAEAIRFGIIA
ncbi:helix-turn-helix transcriptional regulator [Methylobacterium trifolii]|uniref:HTH-type quorum sensing-dependent transcriptional regulator RpaR n=1 Tax=Methylobacterium trifolii TaxID=1003092 RepID=A0ABQ4TS02_9HYPH|nr:LuxR family transcriptional regulator [Methylobacterium trifolii]GJE58123.1 HTH-type quorum sensing-dependent transcriptional regulator RpaR [Methylobacterium trifolii]